MPIDITKARQRKQKWNKRNPNYNKEWHGRYFLQWKDFISYLGYDKCSQCSNERGLAVACHHVDPDSKVFNIGRFTYLHKFSQVNVEILKNELVKCIPLCFACHRRLHKVDDRPRRAA